MDQQWEFVLKDGEQAIPVAAVIDSQSVASGNAIVFGDAGEKPGGKKVEAFVGGAPLKIRYNSRLPVVVYAPEGVEVRYRIWSAEAGWTPADKG